MPDRQEILNSIAAKNLALRPEQVTRNVIDGVDGAGKTAFGDELACVLQAVGRVMLQLRGQLER